jgi:hypothetical protein
MPPDSITQYLGNITFTVIVSSAKVMRHSKFRQETFSSCHLSNNPAVKFVGVNIHTVLSHRLQP